MNSTFKFIGDGLSVASTTPAIAWAAVNATFVPIQFPAKNVEDFGLKEAITPFWGGLERISRGHSGSMLTR
jgi:hypothetical protein